MKIVLSIAAALIILFLLIRSLEYKSLYFPLKKIEATPKDLELDYEDIVVQTNDGVKISGWFIPARKPRATLLFCHGNGGNISHRLEKINMFNFLNLNVLIFDYRGYGNSKGRPSEKGLYHDAKLCTRIYCTKRVLLRRKSSRTANLSAALLLLIWRAGMSWEG
jgi:pimeloyl-ACP methyl ester carboxylesterase